MPVTAWTPNIVIENALKRSGERLNRACPIVVRNIKTRLNVRASRRDKKLKFTSKTGKVVYRTVKGGASEPGESPRKVTGRLYDSIYFRVERQGNQMVGIIYSNDKKARRLEYGFVGRDSLGRVYDQKPRPFMRPGLAESLEAVKKILGDGK